MGVLVGIPACSMERHRLQTPWEDDLQMRVIQIFFRCVPPTGSLPCYDLLYFDVFCSSCHITGEQFCLARTRSFVAYRTREISQHLPPNRIVITTGLRAASQSHKRASLCGRPAPVRKAMA